MAWKVGNENLEVSSSNLSDPSIGWPPPDPDRIPRKLRKYGVEDVEPEEHIIIDQDEFHKRQQEDFERKDTSKMIRRRKVFHERYNKLDVLSNDTSSPHLYASQVEEGEESWQDGEGQRLKDFGCEEEVEFYDEDEVPLAELLKRRRVATLTVAAD
jgi:palmitoyltransferase